MKRINRLMLGTVIVCISAVILAVFSIIYADRLTEQSRIMYEHPYQVKGQTQSIRARIAEMSLYLPSLLGFDYTAKNQDEIKQMLMARDSIQDESIRVIRERYLGPPADVDELEAAIKRLRSARLAAISAFVGVTDMNEITRYIESEVAPDHDATEAVLKRISDYADNKVHEIRQTAEGMQKIAIVGTSALCVFIIFMSVLSNISERRKSMEIAYRERLFDLISNSIDDVFLIYDCVTQQTEYISDNCRPLLGIHKEDFMANADVLKDYMAPDSIEKYDRIFENGPLHGPAECDIQFENGQKRMALKLRIYPVFAKNKLHRYITVIYDQTKAVEQQNAMRDALMSAQIANNAKRDFLSRMSHEIRTPMNTIIGMTTIATKHIDDLSYVENSLKKISYSSGHLLSLINDILDMSKIEDNKFTINHDVFDFRQLIESITNIIYPQTLERKQNFEVTITGLHEEMLIGDMLRLNQILLNLLSNALKFTPSDGSIRLEISKTGAKNKQIYLRFVVRDSGIGMDEDFLNRLYKPFEQANNSISQKYGGTGLGMSITKNLVTLMNGSISVKSSVDEGTEFTVDLPFELTESDVRAYPAEFNTLRVLTVDDDQSTCAHAMVLFEQMDIQADWVCSGREAVERVVEAHSRSEDYDVCFIDWQMPDMDGIETTRRIRQHLGKDVLIIIISAYDMSLIEKEAREAGANAFISKPIFISTLYNTLHSVIFPKSIKPVPGAPKEESYSFMGKKLLLAEDHPINQEIAVSILNDVDLIVDCAENGKEALALYESSKPGEYAFILMDIQMPVMDGYETTRAIRASGREDAKDIPIVAMTANAFHEDIVAAKEAGMNGHLSKPIDVAAIYKTLAQYLDNEK